MAGAPCVVAAAGSWDMCKLAPIFGAVYHIANEQVLIIQFPE